jgi:hypothetical protein
MLVTGMEHMYPSPSLKFYDRPSCDLFTRGVVCYWAGNAFPQWRGVYQFDVSGPTKYLAAFSTIPPQSP